MSKILVTGSLGLVGSEAVDFFRAKGWDVVGIDSKMRSQFFGIQQAEPEYNIDIRDYRALESLFNEHKFDAIIHTAAQPSHDYSLDEPILDFEVNAKGTLNLLELTRKYCPEATFVHCSTDKVYGWGMRRKLVEKETRWHSDKPFDEKTKFEVPYSPFGVSKLASDLYVQEYSTQFGIKAACFRCGCITGRRHAGAEQHGFLAYLAKCVKEGIKYKIFGYKGKQVRDLIHSYDLVNAFWHFIQNPKKAKVYNMGGGEERSVSVLEAISLLENETGKKAITEYIEKERFGDRQWDVHNVHKFKKDYPNWDYKCSLADIIKDVS